MRTINQMFEYQRNMVLHQCKMPNSMIWADMGLGKTIVTLTTIAHLLSSGFLRGVVIVAPIRVIRLVWRQEALKWEHTKHLKFSMVTGTKDQRTRALMRPADVYLVNYENLGWLSQTLHTYYLSKGKPAPFDGIVWDEVSKCKNSSTARVKSFLKIVDCFKWSTGLTGTPASNGYKDLHGQYLVVDKGERLGTSKTAFKHRFYRKESEYKEVPYEDTEDTIKRLIGDITLEMSAADYNPLPDLIVNDVEVEMPENLRAKYEQLEKEFFMQLDNGTNVEVFNQASLTNKILQFSNGAIYPIPGMPLWEPIHELKLDALEEIIDEANGSPILCSYSYRSDAARIMEKFKDIRPINLTECKSEKSLHDAMHRWATGDCQLMIGHPACLHPTTKVLTQSRGWINLVDVGDDDLVFDGVEFVRHDGCSYSGYRDVVDVFGITMTPDHKLLVGGEWERGQDVRDSQDARSEALYQYQGDDQSISEMLSMRGNIRDGSSERSEAQPVGSNALPAVHWGRIPSDDQHSNLANLVGDEAPRKEHIRQKLQGARDQDVSGVGGLYQILRGYVRRLLGRSDYRTGQCEWDVLQGKLHMVVDIRPAGQQEKQSCRDIPRGGDPSCGVMQTVGLQQDDDDHAIESRNVGGRSGSRCTEVSLRQGSQSNKKAHVFDLVNCGPRHQFLICNDDGEMFISHNSMGHGIDGLQKTGHTLVWYGLNWSLDLYEQFNARVRRQGQGAPVICHRILMKDTLDQAQSTALDDKAVTQSGLRNAVKLYRQRKGV